MEHEGKLKKSLYTGAVTIGLAVGTMGLATAATTPTAPAADNSAVEADVQDPSYDGSVAAPAEDDTLTDAEEAAQLEALATVTADEAAAAASDVVPGEVVEVELDDENGSVVYSVEIVDSSGAEVDVKVDAGTGEVLDQQIDDDDESSDSDVDGIQHENEHEGDNDPDENHED